MLHKIKSVIKKRLPGIYTSYRIARGTDYKILSRYLLNINKLREVDAISSLTAACLREIMGYNFFGLVLKKNNSVYAWLDPASYKDIFVHILRNDFPGQKIDVSYRDSGGAACAMDNILSLSEVIALDNDTGQPVYVYLSSEKTSHPHYREILNILAKTTVSAIHNASAIESLQGLAVIDPVTDCYNRTALSGHLDHAVASAKRYSTDLSLIIFDLDRFKEINDIYGHHAGDAALRETAKTVSAAIRKSDCLARYGGDEFIIILPNTNLFVAVSLAERLRKAVAGLSLQSGGRHFRLTASFGVAALRHDGTSETLLREADEMLYRSKARGRNRVTPHAGARRMDRDRDIAAAR